MELCKRVGPLPDLRSTHNNEDSLADLTVGARNAGRVDNLIPLKNPVGYSMRVCDQDGTVYKGNNDQLEAWKYLYLPKSMEMEVIGAVDDFPCEALDQQLVLLLGGNKKVYAYEDELLHLVAGSVKDLKDNGFTFPGSQTYKLGDYIKGCTKEEKEKIMNSKEIQEMREEFDKLHKSLEVQPNNCILL